MTPALSKRHAKHSASADWIACHPATPRPAIGTGPSLFGAPRLLARFAALVGVGALDLLLNSMDASRSALSILHLPTTPLDAFRDVVVSWRAGIDALPITLDGFLTADVTSAEVYLRALKRVMDHPTLR